MYTPALVPTTAAELPTYLDKEVRSIALAFASKQPYAFLQTLNAAPAKPQEGLIVKADGVNWNPNSGPGFYGYVGGVWVLMEGGVPGIASITFNRRTANYTLVLADVDGNTWVEMNVAGANTLTVPPHSSVAAPLGKTVLFSQYGAGQVTLTPGSGVTLRTASSLTTRAQYSSCGMTQVASNEWYVFGDLT